MAQKTSPKGLTFLIREEGVRRYAYNDPHGNATFGVGHLLHMGPVTEADRHKWGRPNKPHSLEYVTKVLQEDLLQFEATVRSSAGRELPQHQFDACVSLAFNLGQGGFSRSAVARWLRSDDVAHRAKHASIAFLTLDKGDPNLRPRRKRESELFYKGKYS